MELSNRPNRRTIACNGAGGRVGFEINASRAGPLMRGASWQKKTMKYVNFVYEDGDDPILHVGPVRDSDAAYLRLAANYLKPRCDEDYMTGQAVILNTAARFSYVLDGAELYWCVEWEPGLLVVKMTPDCTMSWVALRSPAPNFGGREPLPDDGDPGEYVHSENPQYNLVFIPWDAQYDKQEREWKSFNPADTEETKRFENALAHVNSLSAQINSRFGIDSDNWFEMCKQNLAKWSGDGVRLKTAS